jgi:hypothetical protein
LTIPIAQRRNLPLEMHFHVRILSLQPLHHRSNIHWGIAYNRTLLLMQFHIGDLKTSFVDLKEIPQSRESSKEWAWNVS